jgi:kynureninase
MQNTLTYAQQLDANDPLNGYRAQFYLPIMNGKPALYFTGNSLGLQPRATQDVVLKELEDWATFGVEGHFHARNPWLSYHEQFAKPLATLTGAKETEVVCMNQLTVNLHLLLVSFYRPQGKRYKIICEAKAFPSDQYALESHVKHHGYAYDDAVVEVHAREGEYCIRHEDVIAKINEVGSELALVMIGGVNYFTGQVFNMQAITAVAHQVGALAGFDLAHAIGNIKLELHNWNVDFATWCSYKYLNSGPGGVSGAYIHERHATDATVPRFAGWWGHDKETRFKMNRGFVPMPTAEAWQLSNAPVLSMAAHKASLDIFMAAGIDNLFAKRDKLTAYLEFIINDVATNTGNQLQIITPSNPAERGSQLSVVAHGQGKALHDALTQHGVIADWREPNVIRLAPVPMYNSFEDCFRFGELLTHILNK